MDTDLNPGCSISSAIPPTPATNAPGKAVRNSPSVWAHETYSEKSPGFWLLPGAALSVAAIWRMKQQAADLSVSSSLSL